MTVDVTSLCCSRALANALAHCVHGRFTCLDAFPASAVPLGQPCTPRHPVQLPVAFSFCQPADGWARSALGRRLRCVLVCSIDREHAQGAHNSAEVKPT